MLVEPCEKFIEKGGGEGFLPAWFLTPSRVPAHDPPPQSRAAMLKDYREQFVNFHEAVAREEYLHYAGLKETLELEAIYDRYADLFTLEAIQALRQEFEATSLLFPTERDGLRRLAAFAERGLVERTVARLTGEIARAEHNQILTVDGGPVYFHDAAIVLAREPVRERRRRIHLERLKAIESINTLRAERLRQMHERVQALGYSSYFRMVEQQTGLDIKKCLLDLRRSMEQSEMAYRARFARALARDLRVDPADARHYDQPFFSQYVQFDERFPSDGLRTAYRETLSGLGIQLDGQDNIDIDDGHRPHKHPRAFCSPIRVPDEIKLVIRPTGGQNDYQSFLHEGGHAQHFAWTSRGLLPEFHYSGDHAVNEGFAFLFNYLVHDPFWLDEMIGFASSDDFVQGARLLKLLFIRRSVAKLDYEVELYSAGEVDGQADRYVTLLSDATGFRYAPAEYLIDTDDGLYCADYLRGLALEVLLRDYLRTRFGKRWWRNRRAGIFLIDLWNTGQRYPAEELAKLADLGELSFERLFTELLSA